MVSEFATTYWIDISNFPGNSENMSQAEKCKSAAREWKELNKEGKDEYEGLSVNEKTVNVEKLTDEQKGKLVKRHTKQLLEQVQFMKTYTFFIFVETTWQQV